ncbi:MAG: 2-(3-amino-3-carboxypropyl)histidine synthase subunit 1/2 [Ignisphaera sp.]|jgi:2-(3-amino-3-carboxypropyl)histidine synthase|nr:2-(3-amino-3-carboxypropyl)histidine synthase subunit 1/2 [Ignisphaera sp.]MCC6055554.1 2-(3-amino-3-carboxypropyl)histidine synthase subunit 1/2 [Desulfurococcaceae archaeon]
MSYCQNYDFEINTIVKFLREIKAKKVLLQIPEGLQLCAPDIIRSVKSILEDIEIVLSQNPSFGSCLVDDWGAQELGAEAIVHIGHVEYKYYKPKLPTLFIRGAYQGIDRDNIIELLLQVCKQHSAKAPICVGTTAQHMVEIQRFIKEVKDCKILYKGVALGCAPINPNECSTVVIIAGGRFHCIAQALYNIASRGFVNTLCIDPYTGSLWNPEKDVRKVLNVRLWKVREVFEAHKWLIIDGFYGQHRPHLIANLIEKLRRLGKEYLVTKALRISRDLLDNIGAENFDAIVIAACPHIALDLADYRKPVITIGEAIMALDQDMSRYIYPW